MPSFVNNLDAVVQRLGAENVGVVWGLANVDWANDIERDDFLDYISGSQER